MRFRLPQTPYNLGVRFIEPPLFIYIVSILYDFYSHKIGGNIMTEQEYNDIRKHKEDFMVDGKYKCPACHKIFNNKGFSTHIFKQHVKADNGIKNSGGNNGHYSDASYRERQRQSSQKYIDEKYGKKQERTVACSKCGKEFTVVEREKDRKEKYFCSISCANSHVVSEEQRKKISESIQNLPMVSIPCIKCGRAVLVKHSACRILCNECRNQQQEQERLKKESTSISKNGLVITGRKLTAKQKMELCERNTNASKHYYRLQCQFNFALSDFPDEFDFDLIRKYGWYKAKNKGNNPNGVSRDHMYSVMEGYRNNVDPSIISHPANCRLIRHNDNISKLDGSTITLEELLDRIEKWNKKYNM